MSQQKQHLLMICGGGNSTLNSIISDSIHYNRDRWALDRTLRCAQQSWRIHNLKLVEMALLESFLANRWVGSGGATIAIGMEKEKPFKKESPFFFCVLGNARASPYSTCFDYESRGEKRNKKKRHKNADLIVLRAELSDVMDRGLRDSLPSPHLLFITSTASPSYNNKKKNEVILKRKCN